MEFFFDTSHVIVSPVVPVDSVSSLRKGAVPYALFTFHLTSAPGTLPGITKPDMFIELNFESDYQPQAPPSQGCLDWMSNARTVVLNFFFFFPDHLVGY